MKEISWDILGPQHGLLNYQLTSGLFRFVKQTVQLHRPRVDFPDTVIVFLQGNLN